MLNKEFRFVDYLGGYLGGGESVELATSDYHRYWPAKYTQLVRRAVPETKVEEVKKDVIDSANKIVDEARGIIDVLSKLV